MKMSKKFLAGALIFSACSALSTVAQADNTITFNGIVSDTTCTATIDGGVTAIDMGTTSVADLKAYTFGAAKNFSFSLADLIARPRKKVATVSPASLLAVFPILRTAIILKTRQLMSRQPASLWPFSTKRAM